MGKAPPFVFVRPFLCPRRPPPPRGGPGTALCGALRPAQSQVWDETSEVAASPSWAFSATSSAVST